ncbi:MAG: hypothetical protein ACLU9S_14470 [Oscillospiraceae bacterium]
MPIIFAQSIASLPATIIAFTGTQQRRLLGAYEQVRSSRQERWFYIGLLLPADHRVQLLLCNHPV